MKRIIVTGANKGIGLAIVKRLLAEYPDSFVYLGSRDVQRGEEAIKQIESEMGAAAKGRVKLLELDVTSDSSVQKAAEVVKAELSEANDQLYGLVNNAGGGGPHHRKVLELNTYGVCRTTEAFLPMIKSSGRVVQVSSGSAPGFLKNCSDQIKVLMANTPDINWDDVESQVIKPALEIVENSSLSDEQKKAALKEKGLGENISSFYGLSKACVNTYTFIMSRKNPDILMNSCSPGWIETDLSRPGTDLGNGKRSGERPKGMLPVEKGTIAPIHLLMDELEGNGRYYGSDAKRSPMHKSRDPDKDPEYSGEFP